MLRNKTRGGRRDGAEIFEDDEGAERLVRERKAMIVEKAKAD